MKRNPARKTRDKKALQPRLSKARLEEMIEAATVDCHDESEQMMAWFTMLDENLVVPFETTVLGVPVTVERVDLNRTSRSSRCAREAAIGRRSPSSIFRCPHRGRTARSGSRHTATGTVADD